MLAMRAAIPPSHGPKLAKLLSNFPYGKSSTDGCRHARTGCFVKDALGCERICAIATRTLNLVR